MKQTVVALISFLLLGCRGDYSLPLPNGYEVQRLSAKNAVITDRSGRLVTPEGISSYQVIGDFVVGEIKVHLRKR